MRGLGAILISLVLGYGAVAQPLDADSWQVVLYESGADSLLVIGAAGVVEEIDLPAAVPRARIAAAVDTPKQARSSVQLRLSADRAQIAVLEARQISMANLETGACCVTIDLDAHLTASQTPGLVDFRPDGSQLAVYYVDSDAPFLDPTTIGMLIFARDGTLLQAVDGAHLGGDQVCRVYNHPYGWRADGLYFALPICSHEAYVVHRWDPDSDVVDSDVVDYAPGFRDALATTGEVIHVAYNEDYPLVDSGPVVSNVVVHETAADDRIIFATGTYTSLPRIYWVSGGDQVAMQFRNGYEDSGLLLDRQGAMQTITAAALDGFVGMTAAGWLTWQDGRVLRHYSPQNPEGEILVNFERPGAIVGRSFPDYAPSDADARFPLAVPVVCEGPLPSRLEAGHVGLVLPDAELDVYSEAQGGGEIVGHLSGERGFWVIGGPVCGDVTWWRIMFDDDGTQAHGWIPESSGDDYLTDIR